MLNEIRKYRSQFFQIAGLSCMSPLGKIFLDIKDTDINSVSLSFFIHFFLSLMLFCIGIIFIEMGNKVLKGEK